MYLQRKHYFCSPQGPHFLKWLFIKEVSLEHKRLNFQRDKQLQDVLYSLLTTSHQLKVKIWDFKQKTSQSFISESFCTLLISNMERGAGLMEQSNTKCVNNFYIYIQKHSLNPLTFHWVCLPGDELNQHSEIREVGSSSACISLFSFHLRTGQGF